MLEMQYVVFKLSMERFCVDISNVSNITEFDSITSVPNAPDYIAGIINLRGDIIPIIDLKKRFNIIENERTHEARVIVISFSGKDVGFIVDSVSEVLRLPRKDIAETPALLKNLGNGYMTGVAKVNNSIAIVLDLELIFSEEERDMVIALKEE